MAKIDLNLYYLDEENECYVMRPHIVEQYRKVIVEQLRLWVEGKSLHTDKLGEDFKLPEGLTVECCPDFSCCAPQHLWPKEKREELQKLYLSPESEERDEKIHRMLMGSLRNIERDVMVTVKMMESHKSDTIH